MIKSISITVLSALILVLRTSAFSSPRPLGRGSLDTKAFSSLKEPPKKEAEVSTAVDGDAADVEGLPWWWELVWKLDMMKKGKEGEEIIFGDSANVLRTNIEQIYGGYDSLDGCPLAEGKGSNCG
jgi:hypothetical protein